VKGIAAKVIAISVGILVVFALLVAVIPQIQTNVTGFTTVNDEVVATGDGVTLVFDFTLERQPVEISGEHFKIWDDVEIFTDATGVVQVTFNAAVTNLEDIYANYDVEDVPLILTTLANLWWVPLTIVLVLLITATATRRGRSFISKIFRSRRRRRRRR